jgi:acyl carrier protein
VEWPVAQAPGALRYLSQARHTGKLTLSLPRGLKPDGTVLVSGGTGVLGGLVARHLVARHGVRHLLLASRGGAGAAGAGALVAELEAMGASVTVAACDMSSGEQVAALVGSVPGEHPLTGVIHAAGVLSDGMVGSLTAGDVAAVFGPKAGGAFHLDRVTRGLDVDVFVLFSSAAGTLGNPGQGNYAAANAYLDALAARRRGAGLPGISLAWGLWEQASGMTGHLDAAQRARMARGGVAPLATADALALLDAALGLDLPVLVPAPLVPPADPGLRPALMRDLPGARAPRAARAAAAKAGEDSLARRLAGLPAGEQRQRLLEVVRGQAAAVLGHASADGVDAGRAFKDLGFDSLTAVELRNRLGAATGLRLPPTLVFDYPTPAAVAAFLYSRLEPEGVGPAEAILREIEQLDSILSGFPAEEEHPSVISARLEALLWKWKDIQGEAKSASQEDLKSATDDEIFDVLDNELGIA